MIGYVLYITATGEITTWGGTTDTDLVDVPAGQLLMVTSEPAGPATHYVTGGVLTPYGAGQAADKAVRPPPGFAWSNSTMAYLDDRDLATARAQAWDRVKAQADAIEFGTFTWDGDVWQCDEKSAERIRGAVLRTLLTENSRSGGVDWVKADNSVRFIANGEMGEFGDALQAHVEAVHDTRQTRRTTIDAETDFATLDAINY